MGRTKRKLRQQRRDGRFRVFAVYGLKPITIVPTVEEAIALVIGDVLESGE